MIAKQYTVALPADYDMGIIRQRVASKGASFDGFAGLAFKAFLIQEKGKAGAIANAYAPFYLWSDVDSIWPFVAGPGFRGIVESFGPTPIQTWLAVAHWVPPHLASLRVRSATRLVRAIPADEDIAALREQHIGALESARDEPNLAARVIAWDLKRWSAVTFSLWTGEPMQTRHATTAGEQLDAYEVLHMSTSGRT